MGALLTLARAWYVAGKPPYDHLPSLGTFSGWVKVVGGILEYAGVSGFLSNLEQLYDEADEESAQWEAFLQTWYQAFGEERISVATIASSITASTDAGGADDISGANLGDTLPETLQLALKEKPQSFKVRLGKALDKRVDTCFGEENFRLEKTRDTHSKTSLWRVFAGDAGSSSLPTRSENRVSLYGENSNENGGNRTPHPPHAHDAKHASSGSQAGAMLVSMEPSDGFQSDELPPSPAEASQREVYDL